MPPGEMSLLLWCVQCGELDAGTPTTDADLIPAGTAGSGRCHECGNDTFEQVTVTIL
jgi:hypothetical protein